MSSQHKSEKSGKCSFEVTISAIFQDPIKNEAPDFKRHSGLMVTMVGKTKHGNLVSQTDIRSKSRQ
jgi:hypothetical protein